MTSQMAYMPSTLRVRSTPLQPLDIAPAALHDPLGSLSHGGYSNVIPELLRMMAAQNASNVLQRSHGFGGNDGGSSQTTFAINEPSNANAYSEALPLQQVPPTAVGPTMVTNGGLESCFFYRSPNPAVRQRTAQACDKCRDRKTKVSRTSLQLLYTLITNMIMNSVLGLDHRASVANSVVWSVTMLQRHALEAASRSTLLPRIVAKHLHLPTQPHPSL